MSKAPKKWTIIFLVSAKSNLYNEMIAAINEIYKTGSNEHINYIIIYDGLEAGEFKPAYTKPCFFYANNNTSFTKAKPEKIYAESDLFEEKDLSIIIHDIKAKFPAEHYGFVYKGHGGRGNVDINNGITIEEIVPIPKHVDINNDEEIDKYLKSINKTDHNGLFVLEKRSSVKNDSVLLIYKSEITRSLTHVNIANVLRKNFDGARELGFVFMDCCWAMQIENLYEYKYITKYYVASADEMPALGLGKGYSTFCRKLNERPQAKYDEIADLLISLYYANMYDDYDQEGAPVSFSKMGVSLTCADATDLKYFREQFDNFCDILNTNMDDLHLVFAEARDKCYDFTYEPEEEFGVYNIDLMWFLENLLYFNRKTDVPNEQLEISINGLMRICMLYLRKSFMGSNYQDPYPGNRKRVCRGITITFPIKEGGLTDNNNQIGPKRRGDIKFYKETGWPAVLETYFETVKKYTNSIAAMNEHLKIQVVESFKERGFKNISAGTLTVQKYHELIEGLQSINLDYRWGKKKFIKYN
jgi:hypothetical protein